MKPDPVASVRWFDAEQALTWTLEAYYAACREVEPPPGLPFHDPADASPWASMGDFVQAFHSALTLRLSLAAFTRGGVPHSGSASEVLAWPEPFDKGGKIEFFERLKMAGLPVPDEPAHNATAGEPA